ncbi:MAG: MarR family transcriptional regulator [Pseudonocardiaceae bacterium]|nr:MarR family transcriptional regulator [Pseudonocardiaceae bacterium]
MTTLGVDSVRTAYLVKQLELAVRARLDATTRQHGLTVQQYTALAVLRRSPGLSSAQLARRSFVSAQTMQEMVASLQSRGLVHREPDSANRRVLRIRLTEDGEAVLAASDREVDEIERDMLADLDSAQIETLRTALRSCTRRLVETT